MASPLRVDVAIVGAGPAGSTLAALLAARGRSAALLDRDAFPRDKLCGEFLSWDALPLLDAVGVLAEIEQAGAPAIEHCRVIGSGRSYEIPLPRAARGVTRLLLDDALVRAAERRGAVRLDGWTVTELDPRGRRVVAECGGERREIVATVLAGAWGRWGRFDAQLGRGFVRDRARRHFGFKRHYRALPPRQAGTIELHPFEGGYLGVNDVEGGLTNICGLVHAHRLSGLKGRWDAFVEEIRSERAPLEELFSGVEPAQDGFLSSEPVIFRGRSAVEQGIFLTGDASGIVDPLAGNGMAMAIQSAFLAASFLLRLLDAPADRESLERAYAASHHRLFAGRIRWSRLAARLLSRPPLLDTALYAVRSPRIGRLVFERTRAAEEDVQRLLDGVLTS